MHISQIKMPDDAELTIADRDFTIATIAAPTLLVETEDEEVAEGEEGEVQEGAEGEESEKSASDGEKEAEGEKDLNFASRRIYHAFAGWPWKSRIRVR